MRPEHPEKQDIPALRQLWQQAFGDPDSFLDCFFDIAWQPENSLCFRDRGTVAAALYWLDMTCRGQKLAYLYAVATRREYRGRGLCGSLLRGCHEILTARGYAGAVLVPENGPLAAMYEKMGYCPCSGRQVRQVAAGSPVPVRRIGPGQFQALRQQLLPQDGVELGDAALKFLSAQAEFFAGDGWLLTAAVQEDTLQGLEYLGSPQWLAGIVAALGCRTGSFPMPGKAPFAWFHPLADRAVAPAYLGFAFD